MIEELFFDNLDFSYFGVIVQKVPDIPTAKRDYEEIEVPGRSGNLKLDKKSFKNISLKYEMRIFTDFSQNKNIDDIMADIKNYLYSSLEYKKLRDTSRPYGFYLAIASDISDVTFGCDDIYNFTITFDCKPFFYLDSGESSITISDKLSHNIFNLGNTSSMPLITIKGTGTIKMYVNGQYIQIDNADGETIIDSDLQEAYNASYKNVFNNISGDFPKFQKDNNSVSFVGDNFSNATIIPRWCNV